MPHLPRKLLKSLDLEPPGKPRTCNHESCNKRAEAPGRLESTYVRERHQYSKRLGRVKNNFRARVTRRIPLWAIYLSAVSRADSRDL